MKNMGLYHYEIFHDLLTELHSIYDIERLAKFVVTKISEAFHAEAGTMFLLKNKELIPISSHGTPIEELKKNKFQIGQGVVGWVIEYMQPVKVENPASDSRFYGQIDLATGFNTRSIIASPIISKNKPLGVLEFLNKKEKPFVMQDLELISMLGREIGIVMENISLFKKINRQSTFYRSITNSLSAGLLTLDNNSNVVGLNPRGKKILEIKFNDTDKNTKIDEVLKNRQLFLDEVNKIIESDSPVMRQEISIKIENSEKTVGFSGFSVKDNEGIKLGTAVLFQDISNIKA